MGELTTTDHDLEDERDRTSAKLVARLVGQLVEAGTLPAGLPIQGDVTIEIRGEFLAPDGRAAEGRHIIHFRGETLVSEPRLEGD
jgi:hypothetical protein